MIVISHPQYLKDEHEAVRALFGRGLDWFHVRKEEMNEEYLVQFTPEERAKMVLHGNLELATKHNLGGVHFNKDLPFAETAFQGITSASCHSYDEVREMGGKVDRILLSPIFDSVSKKGYKSAFNGDQLRWFFFKEPPKSEMVALGGIDEYTAIMAKNLGFKDVAVLGAVWDAFEDHGLDAMLEKYDAIVNSMKPTHATW